MIRSAKVSPVKMRRLFGKFDKNNTGKVTAAEFKRGFMQLGVRVSTADVNALVDKLDINRDGSIDIVEFTRAALD